MCTVLHDVHSSFTQIIILDPPTQHFSKTARPDDTSIFQTKTLRFQNIKWLAPKHKVGPIFPTQCRKAHKVYGDVQLKWGKVANLKSQEGTQSDCDLGGNQAR